MGNYTFENLDSFFQQTNKIILNLTRSITVKPVQVRTSVRQPMLSLPKQIPAQLLLCKTTTCLMQPATTFFVSQMKKPVQNNH